jgi:hypothetical protein
MLVDPRIRAATLLVVILGVGVLIGVAGDRRFSTRAREPDRRQARIAADSANVDRIPVPLEQLGLADSETVKLRVIARRWRSQTLGALGDFRKQVNDIENNMFAEMLCVLPQDKRDRYVAQLRTQHYDEQVIAKRTGLIRSGSCPVQPRP